MENQTQLDKYIIESKDDQHLDRVILEDKTLKLPAIKGKWCSRYITHKKEIRKLLALKDKAIQQISENIINSSPISITKIMAVKQAQDHELITKINKQIEEEEMLVEYCEKLDKIFSGMSYDIGNLVNLIKMETC